jgi:Fe-S cluster assembly protein SufD
LPSVLNAPDREGELGAFAATSSGRGKPGRYWKIDLEKLSPNAPAGGRVTIDAADARIVACDFETAQRDHAGALERAFRRALRPEHKYAHLTLANLRVGAFVHVPAGISVDDPIVVRYAAEAGESLFPYTLVLLDDGARATVIERLDVSPGSFTCGVAEVVTGERAEAVYASAQLAPLDAQVVFTRAALPGRDARISWANAELGAGLSVCDLAVTIDRPGAHAAISTLFFPTGTQHVDIVSTVDHRTGDATSDTLVKSAASGVGQGRYLGNIRIAALAQQSNASLRDDALLLSKTAHIDSIPALEIAANEVKAYHGATVGALDDDSLFYMTSRGIDRAQAERMIALGFFEPAVERFPTQALRDELRAVLERKIED